MKPIVFVNNDYVNQHFSKQPTGLHDSDKKKLMNTCNLCLKPNLSNTTYLKNKSDKTKAYANLLFCV